MCVILAYIALGAVVFATYQGWNFVDGLFFSFAVLGTIGLIDIPASSSSSSRILNLPDHVKTSDKSKLEYIDEDELVEVTPSTIRLRKMLLRETDRRKQARSSS